MTPVSVVLGSNISFECTSHYSVSWEIAQDEKESLFIYLAPSAEAIRRGFVLETVSLAVERLTVLGSVENNETEIYCRRAGAPQVIASYILTIIGNYTLTFHVILNGEIICRSSTTTREFERLGVGSFSNIAKTGVAGAIFP